MIQIKGLQAFIQETASLGKKGEDSPSEIVRALLFQKFDWLSDIERAGIQETISVRNVLKCRKLANLLVSDDGRLKLDLFSETSQILKSMLFSPGFLGEYETKRNLQLLAAVDAFVSSKDLQRILSNLKMPTMNRHAEEVIRETVGAKEDEQVSDAMTRRAALCAFLTQLRQSLGSCFATAPSIIVHDEQPLAFFKDIEELLLTGKLRRTFSGRELSVPMSPSWGKGILNRPILFYAKKNEGNPFWICPILHETLRALDILPEKDMGEFIYSSVLKATNGKPGWISAEDIINIILMNKWEITQKEIQDYEMRPKQLIQSNLMMHVAQTASSRSRGDKVQGYMSDVKRSRKIFCAMSECPLLKTWEFTIASFAEVRLDFCRWNLYTSLGFNYDQIGGIANILYERITRVIEMTKREVEVRQEEYNAIVVQVNGLDARARSASTEQEIRWLKSEHQMRQVELYNIKKLVDEAVERSNKMANLYNLLLQQYDLLFFDYFQEVYDADMHDVQAGPFDDSPAGFRLVYKHGRSNPGLWSRITNAPEFIDALASFFNITEQQIMDLPEVKGIEKDLTSIISQIISHIRTDEFLESAFRRMAEAHGTRLPANPLQHMDQIEKKPWVYTSGGSMHALVQAYFRRDVPPQESSRWVESETELLAFLIDLLRQRSTVGLKSGSFLIHSPTHAFLLMPHEPLFSYSWSHDVHSYAWIKQAVVEPTINLLSKSVIGEGVASELLLRIGEILPQGLKGWWEDAQYTVPKFFVPNEFARYVKQLISERVTSFQEKSVERFNFDAIDSLLYSALPYSTRNKAETLLKDVLSTILNKQVSEKTIEIVFKEFAGRQYIAADELLLMCRRASLLEANKLYFSTDVLQTIVSLLRSQGAFLPPPLIFADSNWVRDHFAFVVNPGSLRLEFWSVDPYGIKGEPISHWKMWLNGSRKDKNWGVFTNKVQYST